MSHCYLCNKMKVGLEGHYLGTQQLWMYLASLLLMYTSQQDLECPQPLHLEGFCTISQVYLEMICAH